MVVMKGAERAPRCRFRALHVFLLLLAVLMVAGVAGCAGAPEAAGPLPERGTETGLLAPELAGTRSGGEGYRLEPDHADATVVVFYRGAYCGLCRERLRQLEAHLPEYESAGARVLAATADRPEEGRRVTEDLSLSFPIVSVDSATLRQWGAADPDRPLPLPASYVLDGRGIVLFRHVGRNAGDRASDLELLAALQQVQLERSR
ncbi:hypothetical protein BH23GEM3_BH23GEM3_21930 [soil metagenome]